MPSIDRKGVFSIWKQYVEDYNIPDCMMYKISPRYAAKKKGLKYD
jgi:hypothetical protein